MQFRPGQQSLVTHFCMDAGSFWMSFTRLDAQKAPTRGWEHRHEGLFTELSSGA